MKVEIWSDVMCPFCYIGKRHFEHALQNFSGKDDVRIEWKSFQLNPDMKTDPEKNINEYLAEHKDITIARARLMHEHVTAMAKEAGLRYDFDNVIVANSFDAHRLSHYAKKYGLQDATVERLFKAYFTEGKNTADHAVLAGLAADAGLDPSEVREMLSGNGYSDAVMKDIEEATQFGIRGVPCFVFNRRFAVSGAQPREVFLDTLTAIAKEAMPD